MDKLAVVTAKILNCAKMLLRPVGDYHVLVVPLNDCLRVTIYKIDFRKLPRLSKVSRKLMSGQGHQLPIPQIRKDKVEAIQYSA